MSLSVGRSVVALLLTVGLVAAMAGVASAAPSYGVNDWSCRPADDTGARPVVLVHGLGANDRTNFATLAPALAAAGHCVFSETYGTGAYGPTVGGLAPMQDSAAQLGRFVERVRAATGAEKVDIVGHSEGSTVPAYYLKFLGGAAVVDTVVGFGSNYRGTTLAGLARLAAQLRLGGALAAGGCPACAQYLPGSDFLDQLNEGGGVVVDGPRYVSIVTRFDEVVTPYTSGLLDDPRATDIILQDRCPADVSGHLALAVDPNVAALVRQALDPQGASPLRCVPFPVPA
ncbi:esterase/lipase family protein [Pseudonocardia alni]|uniref:alpha/beta fold hydrolase n=1 Tax=Pseudonocardia alni TaxID=33907 RepID=UPI00340AE8CA